MPAVISASSSTSRRNSSSRGYVSSTCASVRASWLAGAKPDRFITWATLRRSSGMLSADWL